MSTDTKKQASFITKTQIYKKACGVGDSYPETSGKAFLKQAGTLESAWETCNRPDWMFWALDEIEWRDDKIFRLFACWCCRETPLGDGRKVWDLLTDERSRNAVEVAERYANGESTAEELAAAGDAASAAASAATNAAQADQLRRMITNPFTGNEVSI